MYFVKAEEAEFLFKDMYNSVEETPVTQTKFVNEYRIQTFIVSKRPRYKPNEIKH